MLLGGRVCPASATVKRLKYVFESMVMSVSLYPVTSKTIELMGRISRLEEHVPLSVRLTGKGRVFTADVNASRIFRFERLGKQTYDIEVISNSETLGTATITL